MSGEKAGGEPSRGEEPPDTPALEAGGHAGLTFAIAEGEAGRRLDQILVRRLGSLGRRGVAELFRAGSVRSDGRVAKKGDRGASGSVVSVEASRAAPIDAEASAALDVRLETPCVVVVHKPAGQPTAPLRPGERGTLAGALLGRYPELARIGHRPREPGLLHRLDTQTSGLLVVARTEAAFEHLWRALSEGRLEKRYLAVVSGDGIPESAVIERSLGPDPDDPRRVRVGTPDGTRQRPSITRVRRISQGSHFALVEAVAPRAYRHQIRAHLASIGHPIAGDVLYGGASAPSLGERHALHASYVAWAGDDVVPAFAVEAPLPADLATLASG